MEWTTVFDNSLWRIEEMRTGGVGLTEDMLDAKWAELADQGRTVIALADIYDRRDPGAQMISVAEADSARTYVNAMANTDDEDQHMPRDGRIDDRELRAMLNGVLAGELSPATFRAMVAGTC